MCFCHWFSNGKRSRELLQGGTEPCPSLRGWGEEGGMSPVPMDQPGLVLQGLQLGHGAGTFPLLQGKNPRGCVTEAMPWA